MRATFLLIFIVALRDGVVTSITQHATKTVGRSMRHFLSQVFAMIAVNYHLDKKMQRYLNKLVGLGGAGCHFVRHYADGEKMNRLYINSDELAIKKYPVEQRLLIHSSEMCSKYDLMDASIASIVRFLSGAKSVVLVAGLGGIAGSTLLPQVLVQSKHSGARIHCLVYIPFQFEKARRLRALRVLAAHDRFSNTLHIIDMEDCLKQSDKQSSLNDVLLLAHTLGQQRVDNFLINE